MSHLRGYPAIYGSSHLATRRNFDFLGWSSVLMLILGTLIKWTAYPKLQRTSLTVFRFWSHIMGIAHTVVTWENLSHTANRSHAPCCALIQHAGAVGFLNIMNLTNISPTVETWGSNAGNRSRVWLWNVIIERKSDLWFRAPEIFAFLATLMSTLPIFAHGMFLEWRRIAGPAIFKAARRLGLRVSDSCEDVDEFTIEMVWHIAPCYNDEDWTVCPASVMGFVLESNFEQSHL